MHLRQTDSWGDPDDIETAPDDIDTDPDAAPDDRDTAPGVLLSDDADLDYYEAPRRRRLPWVLAGLGIAGAAVAGVVFAGSTPPSWFRSLVDPRPANQSLATVMAAPADVPVPAEAPVVAAPPVAAPVVEPPAVAAPVVDVPVVPAPVVTPVRRPVARVVSDGPRVEELVVSAEAASHLTVKCGDVAVTGTTSVRLVSIPAGLCTFEIVWFDDTYRMGMAIEQPQTLACVREDGVLRCS